MQESDSTTGVTAAASGTCDIGMSSRTLKDSEKAKGLTETKIAMDGIVVIINKDNPIDNLTSAQVNAIYTGQVTTWKDVK